MNNWTRVEHRGGKSNLETKADDAEVDEELDEEDMVYRMLVDLWSVERTREQKASLTTIQESSPSNRESPRRLPLLIFFQQSRGGPPAQQLPAAV